MFLIGTIYRPLTIPGLPVRKMNDLQLGRFALIHRGSLNVRGPADMYRPPHSILDALCPRRVAVATLEDHILLGKVRRSVKQAYLIVMRFPERLSHGVAEELVADQQVTRMRLREVVVESCDVENGRRRPQEPGHEIAGLPHTVPAVAQTVNDGAQTV